MLEPLGLVALGWALGVATLSSWAILRARRSRATPAKIPAVLVIRPILGPEPWLDETLVSFREARHTFKATVRFALSDADDPTAPVCEAAAAELRTRGIDAAVAVHTPTGPNHRASQLAAAVTADEGKHRFVISADSDVDLAGVDLDALVLPLIDLQVGAAWASPVERWPQTLGDRAMAAVLSSSLHAFPMLAALDGGGMVGKLFAWKPVSEAAFDPLVHFLGEDMEFARRLRSRGLRVAPTPVMAPSRASDRSWEGAIAAFSRWLVVTRAQRPWRMAGYPLLFGATAPIVLLGLLSVSPLGLLAALTALATRLGVALAARDVVDEPGGSLLTDVVLSDALIWAAFVRAVRSNRVEQRGQPFRIAPDGRMVSEAPPPVRQAQ